jgi:hypothetical protein
MATPSASVQGAWSFHHPIGMGGVLLVGATDPPPSQGGRVVRIDDIGMMKRARCPIWHSRDPRLVEKGEGPCAHGVAGGGSICSTYGPIAPGGIEAAGEGDAVVAGGSLGIGVGGTGGMGGGASVGTTGAGKGPTAGGFVPGGANGLGSGLAVASPLEVPPVGSRVQPAARASPIAQDQRLRMGIPFL